MKQYLDLVRRIIKDGEPRDDLLARGPGLPTVRSRY